MYRTLAKLAIFATLVPMLGGCELLRPNVARVYAVETAGYAGRFRLAHDRWPSISEFFNSERQNVCRLTLRAPPQEGLSGYYPTIVIETTVFACRGEGGYCPWVAM